MPHRVRASKASVEWPQCQAAVTRKLNRAWLHLASLWAFTYHWLSTGCINRIRVQDLTSDLDPVCSYNTTDDILDMHDTNNLTTEDTRQTIGRDTSSNRAMKMEPSGSESSVDDLPLAIEANDATEDHEVMARPGQLERRAEEEVGNDCVVALMLQWEELDEHGMTPGRLDGYQILRDRELAMLVSWELNGGQVGEHRGQGLHEEHDHHGDHEDHELHDYVAHEDGGTDDADAQAIVAETGDPDPMAEAALERLRCVGCYENTRPGAYLRAPCNHVYCTDCLSQLFERSMAEETLFPPRCCMQAILLTEAEDVLQPAVAEEFASRFVELSTAHRTYCFEPTCATFIPPDAIRGDVAVCPTCVRITCAMRKQASHAGRDCPRDEALQQLLETAQEEGWRRCGNCSRVIELNYGCNHIT
ncbi:hypothetical protein LTR53_008836, partial [Teratosphaeriaceae sp. CCFEE 6253]